MNSKQIKANHTEYLFTPKASERMARQKVEHFCKVLVPSCLEALTVGLGGAFRL